MERLRALEVQQQQQEERDRAAAPRRTSEAENLIIRTMSSQENAAPGSPAPGLLSPEQLAELQASEQREYDAGMKALSNIGQGIAATEAIAENLRRLEREKRARVLSSTRSKPPAESPACDENTAAVAGVLVDMKQHSPSHKKPAAATKDNK